MPEKTTETALAKALGVPLPPNDRMNTTWWPTEKLWQPPQSPRKYARKEIRKAVAIMRRFGVLLPLVISSDGQVLAHFVAVLAARELGYEQFPVVLVDHLSEAERSALSIALSRFYDLGKFDQKLLGQALLEIEVQMPELGFDSLGIDEVERDKAIAAFRGVGGAGLEVIAGGPKVSILGDIWLCGGHRIGCGDSGSREWLARLMGKVLAVMVFADPPYGVRVRGFVTTRNHREFVEASGEMNEEQLGATASNWFARMAECCRPGSLLYICTDWRSLSLFVEVAKPALGALMNLIVWAKNTAGMGSLYRSQHELIMLFKIEGAAHRNNVELGRHGRYRSNLWQYASAQSFGKTGAEGDLLADHPTPKNKDMIADAMLDCTKRGDVVLDPFAGSGSTLIATETVGRICYSCDLDPAYVDLTVRRWQNWTGRQAVHAENGRKFDDVARERSRRATAMHDHDDDKGGGYGRPPKRHQFKEGQSGNPKGRPRNIEPIPDMVARVRDELIPITINGKPKRVRLIEAAIRKQLSLCLQSPNPKALEKLLETLEKYGVTSDEVMAERARASAESVVKKIFSFMDKTHPDQDPAGRKRLERREAEVIHGFPACEAALQTLWGGEDAVGGGETFSTLRRQMRAVQTGED